jgi:hypothetical protein
LGNCIPESINLHHPATMKHLVISSILTGLTMLFAWDSVADGVNPSVWVYPDNTYGPNLLYGTDTNGVRINDFSECGYKRGLAELPNVTNLVDQSRWLYLTPLGGGQDDGIMINGGLNYIGAFPTNANGFRGVVFLGPGTYHISSTNRILLTRDGVVLKGSGSSSSTGSVLRAETPVFGSALVTLQGDLSTAALAPDFTFSPSNYTGAFATMVERVVPGGTRTFRVYGTNGLNVGSNVFACQVVTWDWVQALGMDQLLQPWLDIGADAGIYERVIQSIEGNWVTLDTALPQTFLLPSMNGIVVPFTRPTRLQNCGVEDLLCDTSAADGDTDTNLVMTAVHLALAENCWVRDVSAQHFGGIVFTVDEESKFDTIAECLNTRPVGPGAGGQQYSFHLDTAAQYILVRDCAASGFRHDFVLSARTPGPNAFVRCLSENAKEASGPHERWCTGTLFDNVVVQNYPEGYELQASDLGNGGDYKSPNGHGWVGAFMVFWNCASLVDDSGLPGGFRVRNPPTAVNWLIGSDGVPLASRSGCGNNVLSRFWDETIEGHGDCWHVGTNDPAGAYDQTGPGATPVQLHSLYYAQLQQRLLYPGSKFREYRLGDIDQFAFTPGVDDRIPVDANWIAEVQQSYNQGTVSGTIVTNLFDSAGPTQATAFTFSVPSYDGEQVVAASLTLGLHFSAIGATFGHNLSIGTTANNYDIGSLGWTNISTNGTYTHTLPIDPALVNAGEVNLALSPNCGVDFAVLYLQVAPIIPSFAEYPSTPEDTFVQGGSTADQNFSGSIELRVKVDPIGDYERRTFLNWNLIETSGTLVDARVQLYCIEADEAGNEQSAAVVPDNSSWSPFTVTWNTQPATSPPFAYWVPQPGQFSQFDVTPQVAAALAGTNKRISFCVDSAADWGGQGGVAYASSRDPDETHRPQLILQFSNSPPSISGPTNVSMGYNRSLSLPVTVADAETDASSLTLTATSSVPSVVSVTGTGGAGSTRTVSIRSKVGGIRPTAGKSVVTLQVSDGLLSASTSFVVDVGGGSDAPSSSPITSQVMDENTVLTVPFSITDRGNVPNNLTVTFSNSNSQLFPPGAVQLPPPPDSTGNRTLVFTPAPNLWGSNSTTIHVDSGFYSSDQTFSLLVNHVSQPPSYAQISSPFSGANFLPGSNIQIVAQAFDPDSDLDHLQFRLQGTNGLSQLLGSSSNAPYSVTWTNPALGTYAAYAIAYDSTGLSATSPPASFSVSVPLVVRPEIVIGADTNNNLAVAWSSALPSTALQSTTNLLPPVIWATVNSGPVLDSADSCWIYYVSTNMPRQFFRLAE